MDDGRMEGRMESRVQQNKYVHIFLNLFNCFVCVSVKIIITRIAALCTYPEQPVCTSLLFTLLFIKSQYTVFCTSYCFALFISLHILLLFLFFYHIYALVLCYFI